MAESKQTKDVVNVFEVFLLQSRANRNLRIAVNQQLEHFGLTMMEWLLLNVASTAKASGLSMTAAATALDVTMPQVTALSAKLVKLRLLRQKTQLNDRRSRHIVITAKGRNTLEDIDEKLNSLRQEFSDKLGSQDLSKYIAALDKLAHNSS